MPQQTNYSDASKQILSRFNLSPENFSVVPTLPKSKKGPFPQMESQDGGALYINGAIPSQPKSFEDGATSMTVFWKQAIQNIQIIQHPQVPASTPTKKEDDIANYIVKKPESIAPKNQASNASKTSGKKSSSRVQFAVEPICSSDKSKADIKVQASAKNNQESKQAPALNKNEASNKTPLAFTSGSGIIVCPSNNNSTGSRLSTSNNVPTTEKKTRTNVIDVLSAGYKGKIFER